MTVEFYKYETEIESIKKLVSLKERPKYFI